MNLFIDVTATDLSNSAVNSASDLTPVANLQDIVLGDNLPLTIVFTDGNGGPSWAGNAAYTLSVGLGTLDANGGADYTGTTSFTTLGMGWTGFLPLTTQNLIDALALQVGSAVDWTRFPTTLRTPYPRPYGGYFVLQIRVIDPNGMPLTYAELRVLLRSRIIPQSLVTQPTYEVAVLADYRTGVLIGPKTFFSANPAAVGVLGAVKPDGTTIIIQPDGTITAVGGGGGGGVSVVSVVTANGVSGTVANPTTTPAITLTLGAITPTSVNALTLAAQSVGFTIAGGTTSKTLTVSNTANVSGTNTGDQASVTGNAGTATALQTARAINGVNFDGTAAITVAAAAGTLTGGTLASGVTASSLVSFGANPALVSPVISGVQAVTGAIKPTYLSLSDSVNVASMWNQQTISDDSHTLTFTGTLTQGQVFAITLYNTDSTKNHLVTLNTPCMWVSAGRNENVSTISVPPKQAFYGSNGQAVITFGYDGTNVFFYDDKTPMDGFRIGNPSTTPTAVFIGDSIMAGSGATPPPSLITLPTYNGQAMASINLGFAGRTQAAMYDLAWTNIAPSYAYFSGLNIAVVWANTNGMLQGNSAATEYSYTEAFCRRLKLMGFKVLVCTAISLIGLDSVRDAYNALLYTNWTGFCDGLIDLAANANIGADGAYSNATYFQQPGGIHPTTAGDVIAAGIMQTAINLLVSQLVSTYLGGALTAGSGITITQANGSTVISASSGGGNVSAAGTLTSNAVVLGAGTKATAVVAGITTDGTSKLILGVNTTTLGAVKMFGSTSGDATVQPPVVAGTATIITLPNASSTLPIFGQQITFAGPTAARTVTFPDASFTVARTDAANTFTGHQTIEGVTSTGATGTGAFVFATSPTLVTPALGVATGTSLVLSSGLATGGASLSASTSLIVPASTTGVSSIRIPHGAAPTSPVNGDFWSTTSGAFMQVNGSTVGPFGTGGSGGATGPTNSVQANVSGTSTGVAGLLMNATSGALTQTQTALTSTYSAGLTLTNTSAAVTGNTQNSPSLIFHGSNFDENAVASKTVDFRITNAPPSGNFFNYGKLNIDFSLNGGSYNTGISFDTSGNVLVPSFGSVNTPQVLINSEVLLIAVSTGTVQVRNTANNADASISMLNVVQSGKTTTYNAITTAGWGAPAIYGNGRVTAVTNSTSAAFATYTVGTADGSFLVSANILVTAATVAAMTCTCTYTDESNTSRTLTMTFSQISGTLLTSITNATGTGAYEGVQLHIRCKASTAITFATVGTVTGITYNAEAVITQIA